MVLAVEFVVHLPDAASFVLSENSAWLLLMLIRPRKVKHLGSVGHVQTGLSQIFASIFVLQDCEWTSFRHLNWVIEVVLGYQVMEYQSFSVSESGP